MYRSGAKTGFSLIPVIQVFSLALIFSIPALWGAKVFTSTPQRYERVVVQPGDTVWSIVERRASPSDDLGEAAYRVASINHLAPKMSLRPGQVLLLPHDL